MWFQIAESTFLEITAIPKIPINSPTMRANTIPDFDAGPDLEEL